MAFSTWREAYDVAVFRAWAARRRYRVSFDRYNRLWSLTELVDAL